MRLTFAVAVAAGLAASLMVTGCQASGADKTGGQTVALRFASIDALNDNGQSPGPQAFVDGLARISGGNLKAEVATDYGKGDPQAETNLVKAIASGDLDGGWPASRAFANAGMPGLAALEAPMTITSYAAEKAVVSGPVAPKLLATLDGSGVVGLGLAVGPLRRPFAAKAPLLGVTDWKGAQFRVFNSPVQHQAISALGASPVDASFDWVDRVRAGTLRGAEFDIAQYAENGLSSDAGEVTGNVVLWPKVYVLSLSHKRFDSLTTQQQGWVREAARIATEASVDFTYDEKTVAQQLCAAGVHFQQASPDQLSGLRRAFAPTLATMAADATTGPLLRQLQAVAAQHEPDVVTAGAECSAGSAGGSLGAVPTTKSALPDGVYRAQITTADAVASLSNQPGLSGTWTLTVQDGGYQLTCRPTVASGGDCGGEVTDGPVEAGDLRGTGNTVYFVYDPKRLSRLTGCRLPPSPVEPGHCWHGPVYRMSWTLSDGRLTFSDFVAAAVFTDDQFLVKPWRKIA
ncbi:MAG: TRAP transporter substrate-binding protein [Kineosporiaceae bacterium]